MSIRWYKGARALWALGAKVKSPMDTEQSPTDFRQKSNSPDLLFIKITREKYFWKV